MKSTKKKLTRTVNQSMQEALPPVCMEDPKNLPIQFLEVRGSGMGRIFYTWSQTQTCEISASKEKSDKSNGKFIYLRRSAVILNLTTNLQQQAEKYLCYFVCNIWFRKLLKNGIHVRRPKLVYPSNLTIERGCTGPLYDTDQVVKVQVHKGKFVCSGFKIKFLLLLKCKSE